MRNLANGYLYLSDENFISESLLDLFRGGGSRRIIPSPQAGCPAPLLTLSPWLTIFNSGHRETYPSPLRSINAVSFIESSVGPLV